MKANAPNETGQKNIKSILDVVNSLLQDLRLTKIPLAMEYVRITEKFDAVTRLPGREWVVTPERK